MTFILVTLIMTFHSSRGIVKSFLTQNARGKRSFHSVFSFCSFFLFFLFCSVLFFPLLSSPFSRFFLLFCLLLSFCFRSFLCCNHLSILIFLLSTLYSFQLLIIVLFFLFFVRFQSIFSRIFLCLSCSSILNPSLLIAYRGSSRALLSELLR